MGNLAIGVFLAAAALVVLAGLAKLRDPAPLVRALRSIRLPANRVAVRLLALGELVVGVAAVVRPGVITGALVALSYLAFTSFVALALRRRGVLASCGCFGQPDTPPTAAHLVVTVLLAASGVVVAAAPPASPGSPGSAASPWSAATSDPVLVATLLAFAALVATLAYLVIAVLPTLTPVAVRSASAPRRG